MSCLPRPLELARIWIGNCLREGDFAIDATLGNGHDTLFLCETVGPEGRVLGFDVQEAALNATRARLEQSGISQACYELRLGSHAQLEAKDLAPVAAAMFNLGYLPGSDKSVITVADETIMALRAVMGALRQGGLITIMCYPGHAGGDDEAAKLMAFCRQCDQREWQVCRVDDLNPEAKRPFLIGLSKR